MYCPIIINNSWNQTAFDENPTVDVRGVLLNTSKTFDKVWHDGIIFDLKAYGVKDQKLL